MGQSDCQKIGTSVRLTIILAFDIIELEARKGLLKNFMLAKITTFLKEVSLEVKKVNWPQKSQIFRYTIIVLGISLAVALFLGGFDFIFTAILNKFVL